MSMSENTLAEYGIDERFWSEDGPEGVDVESILTEVYLIFGHATRS
jgi:hypothetical protein